MDPYLFLQEKRQPLIFLRQYYFLKHLHQFHLTLILNPFQNKASLKIQYL